jgi:hypothetical protein
MVLGTAQRFDSVKKPKASRFPAKPFLLALSLE